MVCDGCERGFHVGCVGVRAGQAAEAVEEEWLCGECLRKGVVSSRWRLGSKDEGLGQKRRRVESLDVNGGEAGSEGFLDSRTGFQFNMKISSCFL